MKSAIAPVHMRRRKTYRSLSRASGIPKSTLHDVKSRGGLERHTSRTKPVLTEKNKIERVRFALSFTKNNAPYFAFRNMHDHIHIDEKWFFMMKPCYDRAADQ